MPVIREIVVTVLSTTRLVPLWCSGALSVLVMLIPVALGAEFNILDATLTLHLSMIMLLMGAAFVLDDPARPLTEALPISARITALLRMVLTLVPITGFWAVLLWLAPHTVESNAPYPRAGLIIEMYALLGWVWAAATLAAARRPDGAGSASAAAVLLAGAVALAWLPDKMAFYLSPGAPEYDASRWRWAGLLAVGVVLLAGASGRNRLSLAMPWLDRVAARNHA